MQLDPGAVLQIASSYHGYRRVNSPTSIASKSNLLRFVNNFQEDGGSILEINCSEAKVLIRINQPIGGKTEREKDSVDYNTLHKVFEDPRCFFLPAVVKPKRRGSRESSEEEKIEDGEPTVFKLSAFKGQENPTPFRSLPVSSVFNQRTQDLGAPFLPGFGPKVPSMASSKTSEKPDKIISCTQQKKNSEHVNTLKSIPEADGKDTSNNNDINDKTKVYGPPKPETNMLPPIELYYQSKTKTEINYLKRKHESDGERIKRKAELSHKDKIEGFNSYLSKLPEFNEQRKINWSKH